MASPALLSRLSNIEAKLESHSHDAKKDNVSDDKLKLLLNNNEELNKKIATLEVLIKEITKKADDFSKITNQNTQNIANNLKTLQDRLNKLEIATKVETVENNNQSKGKKN